MYHTPKITLISNLLSQVCAAFNPDKNKRRNKDSDDQKHQSWNDKDDVVPGLANGSLVTAVLAVLLVVAVVPVSVALSAGCTHEKI